MSIQLYTYPIKSMREIPLTAAQVTPHGFPYDRRFMVFKVLPEGSQPPRRRMTVTNTPAMTLFQPRVDLPEDGNGAKATLTVTYHPPDGSNTQDISMPLMPDISELEAVETALHASPTKAYNMGSRINSWFSSCFGYEVVVVYLGPHLRQLRGNLSPKLVDSHSSSKPWLSTLTTILPLLGTVSPEDEEGITFADVAPYLVVTEESLNDVSTRLPDGIAMDIRKFRPNIVISGATAPYDEDYWGALKIGTQEDSEHQAPDLELILTQNCARCVSINIDFSTGKAGTGPTGSALKKLMKDRRVDKKDKWSPIFGRYGFLKGGSQQSRTIAIGDPVTLSRRNEERTGLGNQTIYVHMTRLD